MDTAMIARVLWLRRVLRRRERWSRAQLEDYQRRELAALRSHAGLRSPFYQRFHQGLGDAPLAELPVLTKATLLDHFNEITTDPTLHSGSSALTLGEHSKQDMLGTQVAVPAPLGLLPGLV